MEGGVHPDFTRVALAFADLMAPRPDRGHRRGGAAVTVYHRGERVVDLWTGEIDARSHPWRRDTGAMSFSTTKGVVATVVHRLVDRGLLAYDEPVTSWWPEFGQAGKERITLRHLLSHTAAMHDIRHLVTDAEDLLDWDLVTERLAAAAPAWEPGTRPGYHALTYGWLVGELIRRVTGGTVDEAVVTEILKPLGIGGMSIGAPAGGRDLVADLVLSRTGTARMETGLLKLGDRDRYRPALDALLVDGLLDLAESGRLLDGEVPAANGVFTARSLARMYSALVSPADHGGTPLVSAATLAEATKVQTTARDAVVGFPMRWRLGYHLAGTLAGVPPRGFGHFGYGGSGAWGDPDTGLAVAMVVSRVAGTPFGDTRLLRVGAAALRCANARRATGRAGRRRRL